MRGNDKAWWSVVSMWTFTSTFKQKLTNTSYHSNNTGHEITLEEDSFLPFPCQIKHKHCWGAGTATTQGEAPLAMISIQQGTERERFLRDSSWLTWMIANTPSSAKGTHILSIYKSYSGSPYMGGFPTNIKKISWGHGVIKKRVYKKCTFWINVRFLFKGQSI